MKKEIVQIIKLIDLEGQFGWITYSLEVYGDELVLFFFVRQFSAIVITSLIDLLRTVIGIHSLDLKQGTFICSAFVSTLDIDFIFIIYWIQKLFLINIFFSKVLA